MKSCLALAAAACGTCIGLLAGVTPAGAQVIQPGQGVADRPRPDYDPIGERLGAYTLFPTVQASVDTTSNYRATDTNPESDAFITLQPNVRLASNWSRHRLDLNAYYSRSFHIDKPSENVSQYGAQASAVYDVSRLTSFRIDVAATRAAESRAGLGSFRNAAEPVRYDDLRTGLAVTHDFNAVTIDLQASAERINYDDARLNGGGVIDQDFRDVRFLTVGGSARYDLRNGIGLMASASYQDNSYDFRPGRGGFNPLFDISRQSSGLNLLGGVSLELSKLVLGYVQVGYITRSYDDPRLRDLSGLSFDVNVLWNVTALTSLQLRAARTIQETSSQSIAGNTRSDASLRVDHELFRNLILNGDVSYGRFKPNGPGFGGTEYGIGAGARYLINRRLTLTGGIRYAERDSKSSFLRYDAFSGSVGLRVAF